MNISCTDENTPIARLILVIRGKQVLLDKNLADLYGVETKVLNQAVKRNLERFPERNCFQLDKEECESLRSQFVTLKNGRGQHSKYLPYAFTEQGVAMLSTVLRSDTAIKVSLQIMDAFVHMRHYFMENREILGVSEVNLAMQVVQNTNDIAEIRSDCRKIMDYFNDPSTYKHFLIKDGQKMEADVAYTQIYSMARKSIMIVDDYVGVKTLDLLRGVLPGVSVCVYSDQKGSEKLTQCILNDFKCSCSGVDISVHRTYNKFHDRYIFLDYCESFEKLFHCGASSKDAGGKVTTIHQIEFSQVYHPLFDEMISISERNSRK